MGQPHGFPSSDDPRLPGPPESPSEPPDVVAQPLMPPSRAIERSKLAEDYATYSPARRRPAEPVPAPAQPPARPEPVEPPATPPQSIVTAEQTPDPASVGGLGDPLEQPIHTLPPLEEEIGGYPISPRTGEPVRGALIIASTAAFMLAALVAMATYWWYWWIAINIDDFGTSAKLIELFDPRPGSGSSVVLVCVMAAIGAVMTAGPGVAAYNVWHGASWSRAAGVAACVSGLLAFFVLPWTWFAFGLAALGTGLLWLPQARPYFEAWRQFANPPRPAIVPPTQVAYGPAPRFRSH